MAIATISQKTTTFLRNSKWSVMALATALAGTAMFSQPVYAQSQTAQNIKSDIAADMDSLMAIYKDLHQYPELSFQEFRTAAKLAKEARKLGFTVTEKVGQTGVVAVMENGPGPWY